MALEYDPALIERFFGTKGEVHRTAETGDRIHWIGYSGPVLKYAIWLCLDHESVLVSGDASSPFGAHSMYEISVPCSHIRASPDGYRPGEIGLSFFYGGFDPKRHLYLVILKAPNGELKVWPSHPFPRGHIYYVDQSEESSPNSGSEPSA